MLDHVIDDGRVRSIYPPGWLLLLCLGEPFGLSWCLNPLLAALTLYFFFRFTALLLNRRAAWTAMIMTGICPFFLYNSASFYSHTSAQLFAVLSLYTFVLGLHRCRTEWYVLAGLAAGSTFLIRPLEGAVCGVALLLLAVQYNNVKAIVAAAAGGVPFGIFYLVYNHLQFGGAFIPGYELYRPRYIQMIGASNVRPEFSLVNVHMYLPHLKSMFQFTEWIVPGAILLLPVGMWSLFRSDSFSEKRVLVFCTALLVLLFTVLQFITSGNGGDCYGPRYLYFWLIPVGILIAAGAEFIYNQRGQMARWVWITLLLVMAAANGVSLALYGCMIRHKIVERTRVYKMAAAGGLSQAVIFLKNTDFFDPHWYTRNGTSFHGSVVYAIDRGPYRNREFGAYYPGYRFYQYRTVTDRSERAVTHADEKTPKILVPYHFNGD